MIKRIFTGDTFDLRSIQTISPIRSYTEENEITLEDDGRRYSVTIAFNSYRINHVVKRPEALIENVADLIDEWIEAVSPRMIMIPKASPDELNDVIENLSDPGSPIFLDDNRDPIFIKKYKSSKNRLRLNYLSEHYEEAYGHVYHDNAQWYLDNVTKFIKDNDSNGSYFVLSDIYREKFVPLINERIEYLEEKILNSCEN